jgi:hypothetical protein
MPYDNDDRAGRWPAEAPLGSAAKATADEQIARLMQANAALQQALAAAKRDEIELRETVRVLAAREAVLRTELAESQRTEEFLWDALHSLGGAVQAAPGDGDLVHGIRRLAETILGPRSAWHPRRLS